MPANVPGQLLITAVHGTWPDGLLRTLFRRKRRAYWFDEEGSFFTHLRSELSGISHKITLLRWSGANSIFVREKTAHVLAEHLSAEHAEHPQAIQLIIAHSHGGNIALRALHHLKTGNAAQSDERVNEKPLTVTLATPFVEIHQADFGLMPLLVRLMLLGAIGYFSHYFIQRVFPSVSWSAISVLIELAVVMPFILFASWYWIFRRAVARQKKIEALRDATRLGEAISGQRLLVIRAIDDEACLLLSLGVIVNYITAWSIAYAFYIVILFFPVIVLPQQIVLAWLGWLSAEDLDWFYQVEKFSCWILIIALLGLLMASRTAHGRELAASPMECQINTQSAPDAIGLSKIITLVRHTFVKSLRHGIYDHEDCVRTISHWVRSQLSTQSVG